MKKSSKVLIGIIAIVLIASITVLATQSDLLQGRLGLFKKHSSQVDYSKLYLYKNQIVSAVTSPVTSPVSSVVVSNVTSKIGTSRVASVVTSPVASAVASAIAVDKKTASEVDTKKLKTLTENILRLIEKEDYRKNIDIFTSKAKEYYKNNPDEFTLSKDEKNKILELYREKNPSEFIFKR